MGSGLRANISSFSSILHEDVYRHLLHLPLLTYSFFSPKKMSVKEGKDDGYPPLILVHGLGGSRGDLLPLEYFLRLFGRKRVYRIGLSDKRSVDEMSRTLARFIQRVAKVNRAPKVDILGYSLGGIISRLAIVDHHLEESIATLITMGTPHHGTFQARYIDTELGRSLQPESETIQKIRASRWPKGVRGITFWSKNDLLVIPPEAARVEGTEQVDMSPFTHFSYLIDPRSWMAVRNVLDEKL